MKLSFAALALLLLVAIAGCSSPTAAGYRAHMDTWIGLPADDLIAMWGPPRQITPLSGSKSMLTYNFDAGTVIVPWGGMYFPLQQTCQTSFTVSPGGTILAVTFRGNQCKARQPEPFQMPFAPK